MTRVLRSLLAKADAWSPRVLLWINLALAGFVSVAHGGALLVARANSSADVPDIESLATVSLPLAALVFVSGVLGLAVQRLRHAILGLHGAVFLFAAIEQFVWGIELLVRGIPSGNFSWSVGLFTATVAYAVYLFSRYTVPAKLSAMPAIFYSPAFALVAAAVVDIGVIVRFASQMFAQFGGLNGRGHR